MKLKATQSNTDFISRVKTALCFPLCFPLCFQKDVGIAKVTQSNGTKIKATTSNESKFKVKQKNE